MFKDQLQLELDQYYSYGPDRQVRFTHRSRINQLSRLINNVSARHKGSARAQALDAGCGFGIYSLLLAEAGYNVFGIDINEEEIRKACNWARERGLQDRIIFQPGDVQNITHGDSTFDLIVCSEVLEHLEDPIAGAREIWRTLKGSGTAIISMPNVACLYGFLEWSYRSSGLRSLLGKPPLTQHQIQHSRYWFGNILTLLKSVGFQVESIHSANHLPYLWDIDRVLEKLAKMSLAMKLDNYLGKIPGFQYFGFNFIVVVSKGYPRSHQASTHYR